MFQYQVSFGEAISRAFKNYCCFTGRASRSEYWFFILFNFIASWVITLLFGLISPTLSYVLSALYGLATLLPSLGLAWRRLHDIGKGGGWFFINFIPLVGTIIYIVWCCQPSEPITNRFGEVPNLQGNA